MFCWVLLQKSFFLFQWLWRFQNGHATSWYMVSNPVYDFFLFRIMLEEIIYNIKMYYINIKILLISNSNTNLLHFENKIYMAKKKVILDEAIFPVIVKSWSILNSMQFDKDPFNRIKITLLFRKEQFQSKLFFLLRMEKRYW